MLAEIITIGDEILIGQIVDTNSAWMAQKLNLIGVKVKQITSVSDEGEHIAAALAQAEERADIILITGGLGPTRDDITKQVLASYFGMGMRRDKATLEQVKQFFEKLNRPLIESNMQQADVPDGCLVIQNRNGTAPCMWFDHNGKVIISMPGVPFEMMYLMEEEILPRLSSKFELPVIYHKTLLTAGIGESFLAAEILTIENALPAHIRLAYLPKLGQVRLRLSGTGSDELMLKSEVESYVTLIKGKVGKYVVAEEDIALEKALLNKMGERGLTLSTAESCTGGHIGQLVTQHAGASAVYQGGAIVYANELKMSVLGVPAETLARYGAVSEEVALAMAHGARERFGTDYSVAVTGIAGPGGGTPEKPVGTVWIAVAGPQGVKARHFIFGEKRQQNIERSAIAALTMILNEIGQVYS